MSIEKPQCFISYSWDSEAHKDWVVTLASAIAERGITVKFDRWDAAPGLDLAEYMETCISGSTHVLIVCTPRYAAKAKKGTGGVGYEKMVITGEILAGISPGTKFIPILRSGSSTKAIPHFLRSKRFVDFTDDDRFDESLDELTRHIRFAGIRADAFVLGTTLVLNINAVSEDPRQEERVQDLWRSVNGLCRNLGVDKPLLPGRKQVINGDKAFKVTMPIIQQMKQTITKKYGPSVAKPYWLGVMSALAGQFSQNPSLVSMAVPLFREIEYLTKQCSIPDEVVHPFLVALKSGQTQTVVDAIMPFTAGVSHALEASE